jgi:hypothetical protein
MVSYVTGSPCEQAYVEPLSVNDWEILVSYFNDEHFSLAIKLKAFF